MNSPYRVIPEVTMEVVHSRTMKMDGALADDAGRSVVPWCPS
jgi:hypothetical protein